MSFAVNLCSACLVDTLLSHPPQSKAYAPPQDSLGGDVLAVGTVSLSAALPGNLGNTGARAHIFASAGGLQSMAGIQAAGGSFLPSLRAVVGAGIALPSALGRLELNLTHIVRKASSDAYVANGIQVGVSAGLG